MSLLRPPPASCCTNTHFVSKHTDSIQGPHESRLIKKLMKNYNELSRPVKKETDAVEVVFGMSLQQIIDVVRVRDGASTATSSSVLLCLDILTPFDHLAHLPPPPLLRSTLTRTKAADPFHFSRAVRLISFHPNLLPVECMPAMLLPPGLTTKLACAQEAVKGRLP
jgi:hypothetical protein